MSLLSLPGCSSNETSGASNALDAGGETPSTESNDTETSPSGAGTGSTPGEGSDSDPTQPGSGEPGTDSGASEGPSNPTGQGPGEAGAPNGTGGADGAGGNGQGGDGGNGDGTTDGGAGGAGGNYGDSGGPPVEPPPSSGSFALFLEAEQAAINEVVSLGVPFPPGALQDATALRVLDANGAEATVYSAPLATWPLDGSVRSVLVAFRVTLNAGATEEWSIEYGAPRSVSAEQLAPNPDGPIVATLAPSWYASSRVIGFGVPASANQVFAGWQSGTEEYLANMDPPWESYGLSCDSTSAERSYYDGPHALYQRFIHQGGSQAYRRARLEAQWYRDNELDWYDGDEVAVYSCADWDVETPLDWGSVRRMLGQGMLDDYLLTGDPVARAALAGLGEAFLRNLPALTSGDEVTVLVTERNMAWPMMGLASYYSIEPRADVRAGLEQLVELSIEWQQAGSSGGFEHDIVRPDPGECGDGPNGASPFMTSLLVDGLMDSYFVLGDDRILEVVVRVAEWYRDLAITGDGVAFQYLWGCNDVDYDDSSTADLNLLISHVFGAAYFASNDEAWLDFGDTMAAHGVANLFAGAPKQYSQSTRTFVKYMGYRALARTP